MIEKWFHRTFSLFATVLAVIIAAILIFGQIASTPVQAASIYLIPDTAYIPLNSSYAMVVHDGNPRLAYYSQEHDGVVLAACANPACTTNTTTIHMIEATTKNGIAMTLVNGNPLVVYAELSQDRLKVAACSDPVCAQPPTITILDSGYAIWNVAITLRNGLPVIAYDEVSPSTAENVVRLAICSDAACGAPPIIRRFDATIGTNGNAGLSVAIADGNPVVAYINRYGGARLLTCTTATCSDTPPIQTLEPDGANVWGISMAVIDSTVLTSYIARDAVRSINWLKVAACTDAACLNPPHIHIVDQASGGPSIVELNHLPLIAYVKQGIQIATCLDVYCNYSYGTKIAESGHQSPIIQISGGDPVVSFVSALPGQNIKVYYGGDFVVNPSPTASNTPRVVASISPSITPIVPPNSATLTAFATMFATITPSNTPTPSHTPIPSDTPIPSLTPTRVTATSPAGATPGAHYFAVRHPTLTWNRISWALGYRLEIDDDAGFGSPISVEVNADALSYTVADELADGIHYWRVQAKKNATTWGNWSTVETFVVSAP